MSSPSSRVGIARKAAVLVAGGGTYATAVYMAYHYIQSNKAASELAGTAPGSSAGTGKSSSFSHLTNPLRTQQFQRIASIYDDRIGRDELFMGILLMRRYLLSRHARGDVLEVGAGTGRNVPYYNDGNVKRVVLSDSSDRMLHEAKDKIRKLPVERQKRFAVLVADASKLSETFPDDTFDTVVDTFGLCSYDDPVAVLREMSRVCKKKKKSSEEASRGEGEGGRILLLEHGRSKDWDFVTKHLDKHAEQHAGTFSL